MYLDIPDRKRKRRQQPLASEDELAYENELAEIMRLLDENRHLIPEVLNRARQFVDALNTQADADVLELDRSAPAGVAVARDEGHQAKEPKP